jgi:hypothetical protein
MPPRKPPKRSRRYHRSFSLQGEGGSFRSDPGGIGHRVGGVADGGARRDVALLDPARRLPRARGGVHHGNGLRQRTVGEDGRSRGQGHHGGERQPEARRARGTVAARIRRAMPHVPPERIVVAPDCGLKYLPREVAFGKLQAMAAGTGGYVELSGFGGSVHRARPQSAQAESRGPFHARWLPRPTRCTRFTELETITDTVERYEAVRWPDGRTDGGKG